MGFFIILDYETVRPCRLSLDILAFLVRSSRPFWNSMSLCRMMIQNYHASSVFLCIYDNFVQTETIMIQMSRKARSDISMAPCKTVVSPLHKQWRYCSLALSHRYVVVWSHWCCYIASCIVVNIVSDDGLPSVQRQAIIWASGHFLSIGHSGINFRDFAIKM